MKKSQEEFRVKSTKEITELKKEQYRLVIEKAHLWDSRVKLEEEVTESYHHVLESTTEMDAVEKAQ